MAADANKSSKARGLFRRMENQRAWWRLSELRSRVYVFDGQRAALLGVLDGLDGFLTVQVQKKDAIRAKLRKISKLLDKSALRRNEAAKIMQKRLNVTLEELQDLDAQLSRENRRESTFRAKYSQMSTHIALLKQDAKNSLSPRSRAASAQKPASQNSPTPTPPSSSFTLLQSLNILSRPQSDADKKAEQAAAIAARERAEAAREVLEDKLRRMANIKATIKASKERREALSELREIVAERAAVLTKYIANCNVDLKQKGLRSPQPEQQSGDGRPRARMKLQVNSKLSDFAKAVDVELKTEEDLERQRKSLMGKYNQVAREILAAREKRQGVQGTLVELSAAKHSVASEISELKLSMKDLPPQSPADMPDSFLPEPHDKKQQQQQQHQQQQQ